MAGEHRRDAPSVGLVTFAALTVLAATQLGASCVDGVTPDCSDPAVCAPNPATPGAGDANAPVPDAGGDDTSNDAAVEPDADADTDADTDGG